MTRKIEQDHIVPYAMSLFRAFVERAATQKDPRAPLYIPNIVQFANEAYTRDGLAIPPRSLHEHAMKMLSQGGYYRRGNRKHDYIVLQTEWTNLDDADTQVLIERLDSRQLADMLARMPVSQRHKLQAALEVALRMTKAFGK